MKYKSIAVWPRESGINLGNTNNESEDTHSSKEEAEGVCALLEKYGFGGDCKVFPLSTRVEEQP